METEPVDIERFLLALNFSTERWRASLAAYQDAIVDLDRATVLDGWSRRMLIAHVAYVALAYARMTDEALATGRARTYPGGAAERQRSLASLNDRSASECRDAVVASGFDLLAAWRRVERPMWSRTFEDPLLGQISLSRLLALRLTELEVHLGDLTGEGPSSWSSEFVELCLPLRIAWLPVHQWQRSDADHRIAGSWLLRSATRAWIVESAAGACTATEAVLTADTDVVIEGSEVDLLAFLLGRQAPTELIAAGDLQLFANFKRAFPGP